jgi:hypothetical protein
MNIRSDLFVGSPLENLDRGVVIASAAGLIANAIELSVAGLVLTLIATCVYGAIRNRIENERSFGDFDFKAPPIPGFNSPVFTFVCQWFGSPEMYLGLLDDLSAPDIRNSKQNVRRYLRETVPASVLLRTKTKVMSLFWLA